MAFFWIGAEGENGEGIIKEFFREIRGFSGKERSCLESCLIMWDGAQQPAPSEIGREKMNSFLWSPEF